MFGRKETATLDAANGKANVGIENIKRDLRDIISRVASGNIPLDQIREIFGSVGLVVPQPTIENIAQYRNAKLVAGQSRI